MSNADRQKRYRDSKRNAPELESVTRDTLNVTESVTRVTPEPDRNAPPVTREPSGTTKIYPTCNNTGMVLAPYSFVADATVYVRRAVRYEADRFETRPEPLDIADTPDPMNRCIYQRQDGTRYLLDATGTAHVWPQEAVA